MPECTVRVQENKPLRARKEPSAPESRVIAAGFDMRQSQGGYLDRVGFLHSNFLVKDKPLCNLTLGIEFSEARLNCRNVKRG